MQTPSGFNVPINNLMKQAKDDIVGTYQYDRSQLAPVSPPQEDSFNWLNAAGLGALAAGLGGLGYLGYRNRARLIPEGFGRRPGSATGAPTTGPEPGPRRPSPAAPINVEEGRPRTVQTTDLNTPEVDYIERALGMFPQERKILEEASELGGVRRVDVSDKGVPTFVGGVVPSEAAKQSRQAKTITSIDDVLKKRAAEIQAQRQYRNELSSTANNLINEIRGTGGTKIVDLNSQASHAAQAMQSGVQQNQARNQKFGSIQQETAKGGAEILQRIAASAERTNQYETERRLNDLIDYGQDYLTQSRGSAAYQEASALPLSERIRMANQELAAMGEQVIKETQSEGRQERLQQQKALTSASRKAGANLSQQRREKSAQSFADKAVRKAAEDAQFVRQELPMELQKLREEGIEITPELIQQVQEKARANAAASVLSPTSKTENPYYYNLTPEESQALLDKFSPDTAISGLARTQDKERLDQYNAIKYWSSDVKDSLFETVPGPEGVKTLRMRPNVALQAVVSAPDLFDKEDALIVSQALSGEKNWRQAVRSLNQQLRLTEDPSQQAEIQSQLQDLLAIDPKNRPLYGVDPNQNEQLALALDRITGISINNLLKNDPNATIANYLIEGGEMQPLSKKGLGYTLGDKTLTGTGFDTVVKEDGSVQLKQRTKGSSSKYSPSDLEAIYNVDGQIGTAKDLGILPGIDFDPETGSGLGDRNVAVLGFQPRANLGRFTELQGTNASGKPDPTLISPETMFAQGMEEYGDALSNIEIKDRAGDYVGGVKGFYSGESKKKAKGIDLAPIFEGENGTVTTDQIADAVNAGVIKVYKNKQTGLPVYNLNVPTKMFFKDGETVVNSNQRPKDLKFGISLSGEGYSSSQDQNPISILQSYNDYAREYNQVAEEANRLLNAGRLESSQSIMPMVPSAFEAQVTGYKEGAKGLEPIYGRNFAAMIRDSLTNPDAMKAIIQESKDSLGGQLALPTDPGTGKSIGFARELKSSGGKTYTQPTRVQAPVADVNDALSLLLAIGKSQLSPRDKERLAGIPGVFDPSTFSMITPEKNPSRILQEVIGSMDDKIYGREADGRRGEIPGLIKTGIQSEIEKNQTTIDNALDDILEVIKQEGPVTEKQARRLESLGDKISAAEDMSRAVDPGDVYYNPEIAESITYRPGTEASAEQQLNYMNAVEDKLRQYGSGFFPVKGTLSDAKDYTVAVPIEGSPETYQYQAGGIEIQPATFLATQLAQLSAAKELSAPGSVPARIPSLDAAIKGSQQRTYRFAGTNPVETKALIDSSTISQISRPGYKMQLERPNENYAGLDGSETISNNPVREGQRLIGQIQQQLTDLDSSNPQFQQIAKQLQNQIESTQAQIEKYQSPGQPVSTQIEVETNPVLYQRRFGALDAQPPSLAVPNLYAEDGPTRGAQGNTLSLANVNSILNQSDSSDSVYNSVVQSYDPTTKQTSIDIGNLEYDPLKKIRLTPRQIKAIQNPGGQDASAVRARQESKQQVLDSLIRTAKQTPGGRMTLQTQPMALGFAPGDMTADVSQGGRIVGKEIIATRPTGSQLTPAMVLTGPNNMSASETVRTYGAAPGQIQQLATQLMNTAAQNRNRKTSNQQALNQFRSEQQELFRSVPQVKLVNPQFKSTPEQQSYLRSLQEGEARRRFYAEGNPSPGQLSLNI